MKKIISLALVLLMIFSISLTIVSCGGDRSDPPSSNEGGENNGGTNNNGNTDNGGNTNGSKDTYEGTRPITLPSI